MSGVVRPAVRLRPELSEADAESGQTQAFLELAICLFCIGLDQTARC